MLPTWETLVTWDSTPARPDTDGARQAGKNVGSWGAYASEVFLRLCVFG